jgi:uncharacterized protein YjeT (DUF2065 family)
MKIIIALFGALICLTGLLILIAPDKFRSAMNNWTGQPRFLFAVIVRVVFGAIFLAEAANLKFPLAMKIIGGISIVAAVILLLTGQQRMDRIIEWFMSLSDEVFRLTSVISIGFGAFIVYVTF